MFLPQIPILATMALVAGPVFFWRSFRDLRTRRLIQNTPTAHIRSMAMGLVEVNGQVVTRSAQRAPFSNRACAYWEVDISTRTRRNGWSVVHRNASGHPFFLRDETGVALVYPKDARCTIRYGVEEECLGISLPDCYADYFREQQVGMSALWRMGSLRFRERVLEEDERVYVLGSAMPRSHAVDVSSADSLQATGTDDLRGQRVQSLMEEATATIRRGENEPTFIISQQSERDLTAQLGLRAMGELVAGPALTLLGLGYWLAVIQAGRFE